MVTTRAKSEFVRHFPLRRFELKTATNVLEPNPSPPSGRFDFLERLEFTNCPVQITEADWGRIDQSLRRILGELAGQLTRDIRGGSYRIEVHQPSKRSIRGFAVFFPSTDVQQEALVIEINVRPRPAFDGDAPFVVLGDVADEESGDVHLQFAEQAVTLGDVVTGDAYARLLDDCRVELRSLVTSRLSPGSVNGAP